MIGVLGLFFFIVGYARRRKLLLLTELASSLELRGCSLQWDGMVARHMDWDARAFFSFETASKPAVLCSTDPIGSIYVGDCRIQCIQNRRKHVPDGCAGFRGLAEEKTQLLEGLGEGVFSRHGWVPGCDGR